MKTIDATLLAHKALPATTTCDLLLVGPLADGTYRGFAGLDRDVVFSPAASLVDITFHARTGVQMSALKAASDLSVDNAEADTLMPVATYDAEGFTQAQIDAGALDKVRFVVLLVNYEDLTAGRCEIVAGGTIGEVRQKLGSLTILELRSLSQQLRQMIVQLDSISCRARFGSQPLGTTGASIVERFPCGYPLDHEWVTSSIDSVGTETDREFVDASLIGVGDDYFAPGMVEILTGDNAGQMVEVEAYDDDTGTVVLKFPTVTALADGVSYRIRRHCTKQWTGHNSCDTFWGSEKPLHYRGEPHIKTGDAGLLNSPGAALPRGAGGTGE